MLTPNFLSLKWAGNLSEQAPLAQLAEQLTLNQWVVGSSPTWCTRAKGPSSEGPFFMPGSSFLK